MHLHTASVEQRHAHAHLQHPAQRRGTDTQRYFSGQTLIVTTVSSQSSLRSAAAASSNPPAIRPQQTPDPSSTSAMRVGISSTAMSDRDGSFQPGQQQQSTLCL